jgi:sarcosine oxidase subunit beta
MKTDLLIIGGGLVGAASACHLARAGTQVWLVEAAQINSGASGQNAGSLHFQIERRFLENGREAAEQAAQTVHLTKLAIAEWKGLTDELAGIIGTPLDIAMHGGFMVAETDDELRLLEFKTQKERELGLGTELLDASALRLKAPFLSPKLKGAAFLADEGHANPRILTHAFIAAATQAGAEVRTASRVTGLRKQVKGFIAHISTPEGLIEINADAILIAAGAWSATLAQMLGIHVPLFPVALSMNVTERTDLFLPYLIQHVGQRLSMKQTEDGNLIIGGGWPSRFAQQTGGGIDLSQSPLAVDSSIIGNLRVAASVIPRICDLNLIRNWTGTTCISADQLPVVGEIDAMPGLFVAAGGSAFTLGPTFARLLSQQILKGAKASPELGRFSPRRFNHLNAFVPA